MTGHGGGGRGAPGPRHLEILALLNDGVPRTRPEIAAATGRTTAVIGERMMRAEGRGWVRETAGGAGPRNTARYTITAAGITALVTATDTERPVVDRITRLRAAAAELHRQADALTAAHGLADRVPGRPDSHAFDAAVLDSGDAMWQPWMVGRDWEPADAPLPWVPLSEAAGVGRPAETAPNPDSLIPAQADTRIPTFATV